MKSKSKLVGSLATAIAIAIVPITARGAPGYVRPGSTEQVNVAGEGRQVEEERCVSDGYCIHFSSVSASGNVVALDTLQEDLVTGDTRKMSDVVVRKRKIQATELVSVGTRGTPAIGPPAFPLTQWLSYDPSLSANGRYVAFVSSAVNLVAGDTNGIPDVFVRDLKLGTTERVSVASDGSQGSGLLRQVHNPSISSNGRYVAFFGNVDGLSRDDQSNVDDVFVHDRKTGRTVLASVTSDEVQPTAGEVNPLAAGIAGASLSGNGHFVVFHSSARFVEEDLNGEWDVFIRDLQKGVTERVSLSSDGSEGRSLEGWFGGSFTPVRWAPQLVSSDGRYVAFISRAYNLVPNDANIGADFFVHDRETGRTERVSVTSTGGEASLGTGLAALSANGRYVVYWTAASLVPGDTDNDQDIYIYDRISGSVEMVSRASDGSEAKDGTDDPAGCSYGSRIPNVSATGRYVSFASCGSNLSGGRDVNPGYDIFLRDRGAPLGGGLLGSDRHARVVVEGMRGFTHRGFAHLRDPDNDATSVLGAELVGATLAYRPHLDDLYVKFDVDHLPGARGTGLAGNPALVYVLRFTAEGVTYELRAGRSETSRFELFRCGAASNVCGHVADVSGGYGTAGESIVAAVPLRDVGLQDGGSVGDVEAFSALGSVTLGASRVLDEIGRR